MQVHVDEIGTQGLELECVYTPDDLPVLAQLKKDGIIVDLSAVKCHAQMHKMAQIVSVDGSAETVVRMQCSRCLEEHQLDIRVEFHQDYVEQLPQVVDEDGGELELSAEQMGLELFDGEIIDLQDEIQQQIVLALPPRPLCSEKCKGLCSVCGANLNIETCRCTDNNISMHFAPLRDFKVEK